MIFVLDNYGCLVTISTCAGQLVASHTNASGAFVLPLRLASHHRSLLCIHCPACSIVDKQTFLKGKFYALVRPRIEVQCGHCFVILGILINGCVQADVRGTCDGSYLLQNRTLAHFTLYRLAQQVAIIENSLLLNCWC